MKNLRKQLIDSGFSLYDALWSATLRSAIMSSFAVPAVMLVLSVLAILVGQIPLQWETKWPYAYACCVAAGMANLLWKDINSNFLIRKSN